MMKRSDSGAPGVRMMAGVGASTGAAPGGLRRIGMGRAVGGPGRGKPVPGKVDWFRFWRDMAIAALAFNVVAGLVTWYYIFPKLGLR